MGQNWFQNTKCTLKYQSSTLSTCIARCLLEIDTAAIIHSMFWANGNLDAPQINQN